MTFKHTTRARTVRLPGAVTRTRPSSTSTTPPDEVATVASQPAPQAPETASKRKSWTPKRALKWAGGLLAFLIVAVVGCSAFLIVRFQTRIYVPLPPTATIRVALATPTTVAGVVSELTVISTPPPTVAPTPDYMKDLPEGRINILVLGTDKRENDPEHYARSDTLLLANVDTISRTVGIMSIPRDLVMNVPGYGKNKVNAAYLFGEYYQLEGGGQALAVQTISQFFNVPIDYYVAINFDGFRKVVDTIGGVDIDVPYSIDDYNYPSDDEGDNFGEIHVHFDEGWQHMDGKSALRYARTRHADNDFARSKRQLQIILAVRQKAMSLDLIPSMPGLIDDLGGMVQTNLPFDKQLALAQLGYGIEASNVMTSSIDSSMIVPDVLPDGSEGLKLDMEAAQPMLDHFFGWDVAGSSVAATATAEQAPKSGAKRKATPVPTRPSSEP